VAVKGPSLRRISYYYYYYKTSTLPSHIARWSRTARQIFARNNFLLAPHHGCIEHGQDEGSNHEESRKSRKRALTSKPVDHQTRRLPIRRPRTGHSSVQLVQETSTRVWQWAPTVLVLGCGACSNLRHQGTKGHEPARHLAVRGPSTIHINERSRKATLWVVVCAALQDQHPPKLCFARQSSRVRACPPTITGGCNCTSRVAMAVSSKLVPSTCRRRCGGTCSTWRAHRER